MQLASFDRRHRADSSPFVDMFLISLGVTLPISLRQNTSSQCRKIGACRNQLRPQPLHSLSRCTHRPLAWTIPIRTRRMEEQSEHRPPATGDRDYACCCLGLFPHGRPARIPRFSRLEKEEEDCHRILLTALLAATISPRRAGSGYRCAEWSTYGATARFARRDSSSNRRSAECLEGDAEEMRGFD